MFCLHCSLHPAFYYYCLPLLNLVHVRLNHNVLYKWELINTSVSVIDIGYIFIYVYVNISMLEYLLANVLPQLYLHRWLGLHSKTSMRKIECVEQLSFLLSCLKLQRRINCSECVLSSSRRTVSSERDWSWEWRVINAILMRSWTTDGLEERLSKFWNVKI